LKLKNILFTLSSVLLLSTLVSTDVVMAVEGIKTDITHNEAGDIGSTIPIDKLYIDNNIANSEYSKLTEAFFYQTNLEQRTDGKVFLSGTLPVGENISLINENNNETRSIDINDEGHFEIEYSELIKYEKIKLVKINSDSENDLEQFSIEVSQFKPLLIKLKEQQKESKEAEIEPKQEEPKQEEPKQEESKQEEPKQEEPKQKEISINKKKLLGIKEKSTFSSALLMKEEIKRVSENGIYTVMKGDNFNAIAKDFNLSNVQLKIWNEKIKDTSKIEINQNIVVSRKGYESTLSNAEKLKLSVATTSLFSTNQQFLDYIKPYADKISVAKGQEKLYVSLMMGQAAHESNYGKSGLASPPYYNLSGVKGSYNGEYVKMWTWEEIEDEKVYILANFRKYPSYEQSLQDYAAKMRNGLSYDTLNYSGTWMRNAKTYEESIKGLSSGTSSYATDSEYFSKVLDVIKMNELYKLDSNYYENIQSTMNISYDAIINRETDTINTKPYGTEGYQYISKSDTYYSKQVMVTKEAKTNRATWSLISIDGKELGWIDKAGLDTYDQIKNTKNISYSAKINRSTDTINSIAWGAINNKILGKTLPYMNQTIKVTKERDTDRAIWSLISIDGKELGWIDKAGLNTYDQIKDTKNISYSAKINRSTDTINSIAWGIIDNKILGKTLPYMNQTIKVTKERVTDRATWSMISIGGKELGWVDKKSLLIETIISQKSVSYDAIIKRKTDTINNKPYGTEGYQYISKSDTYYGKQVMVTKEAKTNRATWSLISIDGKELGWIDKAGLDTYDQIKNTKNISYSAEINRSTDTINSIAWGAINNKILGKTSSYMNKTVKVIKERVTNRATWSLISVNGKELGWVDKKGLLIEQIKSKKTVSYSAIINRKTDTINTKPYGTEGYQYILNSKKYYGKQVIVKKEAITSRATWLLISIDGKELGWIDKAGLILLK